MGLRQYTYDSNSASDGLADFNLYRPTPPELSALNLERQDAPFPGLLLATTVLWHIRDGKSKSKDTHIFIYFRLHTRSLTAPFSYPSKRGGSSDVRKRSSRVMKSRESCRYDLWVLRLVLIHFI